MTGRRPTYPPPSEAPPILLFFSKIYLSFKIKQEEIKILILQSGELWGKICNFGNSFERGADDGQPWYDAAPTKPYPPPSPTPPMRFSGIITAKLDAKGRVYFPSAFRRQLPAADSDLMIRRDVYQPCLVVYPRTVWESEVDRLGQRLNRWNPREAMLLRRFMAGADLLTLDDDGRFLLPKRRLEEVDIAREVAFVGVGDRVELWNVEAANALAKPDDELASLMETTLGAPGGEALL